MKVASETFQSKSQSPLGSVTFLLGNASERALQKRARRRAVTKPLAGLLVKVATNDRMKKMYERTFNKCQEMQFQTNGKLHTAYCGNRWCLVCGTYRQTRMWKAYGEEVLSWKNSAYFVTLTIPNVKGIELRLTLQEMHKKFRYCWHHMRHKEGLEVKVLRATEVTYSKKLNTFHPHLHVLCKGKKQAVRLMKNWLERFPEAKSVAQDIRKADRNSVYEMFKYCAKLATDTRDEEGFLQVVPPKKLDTIYTAMRGLRLWSVAGVRSAIGDVAEEGEIQPEETTTAVKRVGEVIVWEWNQGIRDWADYETGEVLSGYDASPKVERFLKKLEQELEKGGKT